MKRITLLLIFLFLCMKITAQEIDATVDTSGEITSDATEDLVTDATGDTVEEVSLFTDTLYQDIDTASYYELVNWCKSMNLDDSGSREDLQKRLYAYYELKKEAEPEKKEGKKIRRIEIQSARSSEYFTIQEIDEDYILIQGDVIIELKEENDKKQHLIRAQQIILNQNQDILTAQGEVEYIRITKGEGKSEEDKEEKFKGQSFVFNIENWEGVLYLGLGEKEQKDENSELMDEELKGKYNELKSRFEAGDKIIFYYYGDSITMMEEDRIIIKDGFITSSKNLEDPNYRIQATKIWVFAPGEWAIQDAVLYIGRIPLFYLPFFFHPGDELFFHPVIGYRDREGNFIQTTTYFIGRKRTRESLFSFLEEDEEEISEYREELHGIFLRKIKKDEEQKQGDFWDMVETQKWFFKLFADVYSRLGGFSGISVNFLPHFGLKMGIGFSRSLFTYTDPEAITDEYLYTPYYPGDDKIYWNNSNLAGSIVPFRYGMETDFNIPANIDKFSGNLNGNIEIYSDPFFPVDFYDRAEDISWREIMQFEEKPEGTASSQTSPSEPWALNPVQKGSLDWRIAGKANFSKYMPSPLINTFNISNLDLTYQWNKKADANLVSDPLLQADPSREYFYPFNLKFPNTALSINGELLKLPLAEKKPEKKQIEKQEYPGKGFRSPLQAEEKPIEIKPADKAFKLSDIKEDAAERKIKKDSSMTVDYSINPKLYIESPYNHDKWTTQDEIDFETDYTLFNTTGLSDLHYNINILDSMSSIDGKFRFTGNYQTRYDPADDIAETTWQQYQLTDYSYSNYNLLKLFTYTYKPFIDYYEFRETNITYSLNWYFYKLEFDQMENEVPIYKEIMFEWERDYVTKHQTVLSLQYQPFDQINKLDLTTYLPPLDGYLAGELTFYLWILKTYIKCVYKEIVENRDTELEEHRWEFEPLLVTETLDGGEYFQLQTSMQYDIENEKFLNGDASLSIWKSEYNKGNYLLTEKVTAELEPFEVLQSDTTLNLWDLSATFVAKRMLPVDPLGNVLKDDLGQPVEEEEFLPYNIDVSYNSSVERIFLWKNRLLFEPKINATWKMKLQDFTKSDFTLTYNFNFFIYKFLAISFKSVSYNNHTYQYIPGYAVKLGDLTGLDLEWRNPLEDLANSFFFWDENARNNSLFKVRSIEFAILHCLDDWDLIYTYNGGFEDVIKPDGSKVKRWQSTFSIGIEWNPIPELYTEVQGDDYSFEIQ